jgi:uroporphyrinogen-III decarboxylase
LVSQVRHGLLCYAVEGQGSKALIKPKDFVSLTQKQHMFYCKKITDTTILYLKEKVKSGVDAVQILILGRNVISSRLSRILEIHQPDR